MTEAAALVDAGRREGFRFYTGVPCSTLGSLIDYVIDAPDLRYVGATNEGEALAIACGTWLAGEPAVVLLQNSGLGNLVNPLTSLANPFRIPSLLLCSWRARPGHPDEPQHMLMGAITADMLDLLDVAHTRLPEWSADLPGLLRQAVGAMAASGLPFAVMVEESLEGPRDKHRPPAPPLPYGSLTDLRAGGGRPRRLDAIEAIVAVLPDDVGVVGTTGKCARELYALGDRPQNFYQVGSMGCASAIALGACLVSGRRIVVLDGDGAALMRMGNLATIGAQQPPGLVHVLLDNAAHESTGGQPTSAATVDFAGVALSCGYRSATRCDTEAALEQAVTAALRSPGPHLVHMAVSHGSSPVLGRPTVHPSEVARRFRDFLTAPAPDPVPSAVVGPSGKVGP